MADILDAPAQAEIADSILADDNIIGDWHAQSLSETPLPQLESETAPTNEEQLADLNTDRESGQPGQYSEDQVARLVKSVARPGARLGKEGDEQRQNQTEQPSPEAIQEGLVSLDATVEQYQLNDPVLAKDFAEGFAGAFGSDLYKSTVNVEALGNVMAKVALSAANIYDAIQGDPGRLSAIPEQSAKAFASEFLQAWGVDPRTVQVDSRYLAETVFRGAMNFYDTYQRLGGKVTDLTQLNDPANAERFLTNFLRAFGVEGPVDRTVALRVADAAGKYLLGFLGKVQQIQPQPARGKRKSQGRFRSNADIFDQATVEKVGLERAVPRSDQSEFAPKRRGASTRFQTNTDIFSDEVMAAYDRL